MNVPSLELALDFTLVSFLFWGLNIKTFHFGGHVVNILLLVYCLSPAKLHVIVIYIYLCLQGLLRSQVQSTDEENGDKKRSDF